METHDPSPQKILFEKPLRIALAVFTAMLWFVVTLPLGTDDMIYHSMALELYRFGSIPYLGSWDQNFPGIIIFHYIAILLFGTPDLGVRALDVVVQLGFAIVLYRLCRFWLTARASAIAVVVYGFYYVTGRGSLYTERDVLGIISIITAFYLLLRARVSLPTKFIVYPVLAGILTGYAVLLRPSFGLFCMYIIAFLFFTRWKNRKGKWEAILLYAIGSIAPVAAVIVFYYTISGGLHAMFLSTIRFNLDVYSKLRAHYPFGRMMYLYVTRALLIPSATLGWIDIRRTAKNHDCASGTIHSLSKPERFFYFASIVSYLLIAILQPTNLAYHFAPFYVLLCPMASVGIDWILSKIPGWFPRMALALGTVALYIFFFVGERQKAVAPFRSLLQGDFQLEAARAPRYADDPREAQAERDVEHYLSGPGNDTGCVEVCSFDPTLRSHLDRKFAGPYILPSAIAMGTDVGTLPTPHFTDYQQQWRAAYMDSLRINHPFFTVIERNSSFWVLKDPYTSYLHALPGFDSLLRTSYRFDTAFGSFQVFRRVE